MFNSKSLRNAAIAAMAVMMLAGGTWAGPASPEKAKVEKRKPKSSSSASAAGLFSSIPAKSMFCVRINNLDGTVAAVNEYLKGIVPESFDANAAVVAKLGKMLGDEKLPGVNRKQNLAIFAVNVPGEKPGPGPMGDMFIGALIPVSNYDEFISQNPNCGRPDDEGISTVTVDGKPVSLVTRHPQGKTGRFAVLCLAGAREKLIAVRKMLGQRKQSLATALDDDEKKQAASASVWAYVNVKEAAGLIRPMFLGQLEQMKAQLQKMKENKQGPPMMVDPSGVFDFYAGMFKMVMDGTDHVTISLSPASQVCNFAFGLKPVPGTEMAAMVGRPVSGSFGNTLGYLDDGAMMNLGCKVDREGLKAAYMKLIDLVGQMSAEAMPAADLEQLRKLTAEVIDAMGDSMALSLSFSSEGSPAFSAKYVIKVRDEKTFQDVIEKQLKMMQEGTFAKLYKGFGLEMDIKVERGADTYKAVKIDSAKLAFKMGDEGSPQSEMIKKIYGDALEYRWAFVEGYCVYSIGGRADQTIRELIDQVRAGGPKEVGSEMKAALAAIPDSEHADAVGTLNYVRMLNIATGFMPLPGDANQPKRQAPTKSNIAFSARTTADGKLDVQMALPKEHLLEIQSAFKSFIPQIQKQQELQRQKQQEQSKDPEI